MFRYVLSYWLFFSLIPATSRAQSVPDRLDTSINWKHRSITVYYLPDTVHPSYGVYEDGLMIDAAGQQVLFRNEGTHPRHEIYNYRGLQVALAWIGDLDTDLTRYTYDDHDSLIQTIHPSYSHKRKDLNRDTILYDTHHLRVRDLIYRNDTLVKENRYVRDEHGRLDSIVEHVIEYESIRKTTFRYDQSGRVIQITKIDHNPHANYITDFSYDTRGVKRSMRTYYDPPLGKNPKKNWLLADSAFFTIYDTLMHKGSNEADSLRRKEFTEFAESDHYNSYLPLPDKEEKEFRKRMIQLELYDSTGFNYETQELRDDSTLIRRNTRQRLPNKNLHFVNETYDTHGKLIPSLTDDVISYRNDRGNPVREESYVDGKLRSVTKFEYQY